MGEGVGEMEKSQDFQNKELGHGLEGILFLVLFQGSESHSPHRGCCLQDMNIRLEWGLFWAWILVLSQLCCLAQTVWQRGEDSH